VVASWAGRRGRFLVSPPNRPLQPQLEPAGGFFRVLCLAASVGCQTEETLKERERARRIKEICEDLSITRNDWRVEEDPESLRRRVELFRGLVELDSARLPHLRAEYGQALSIWDWYFHQRHHEILEDLSQARQEEKPALEAEAQRYKEEYEKLFHDSKLAYETHFRDRSVKIIHPYSYERVMRHCEVLGDFERALYYLQKYMDAYPEMNYANRRKLDDLRRRYTQRLSKKWRVRDVRLPVPYRNRLDPPTPPAQSTALLCVLRVLGG